MPSAATAVQSPSQTLKNTPRQLAVQCSRSIARIAGSSLPVATIALLTTPIRGATIIAADRELPPQPG